MLLSYTPFLGAHDPEGPWIRLRVPPWGPGPLHPHCCCHRVPPSSSRKTVCSPGLPPTPVPSCFIFLISQSEGWVVLPQSTRGETEARTWKSPAPGPQLPQSPCSPGPGCPLRRQASRTGGAPWPSLLQPLNLPSEQGGPADCPPPTPVWAPHAPRGCPETRSDLGGTGNHNAWVCLPGKQGLIRET